MAYQVIDNRKYEQKLANENATLYDEIITREWGYRYRYVTAYSWGRSFDEPFLDLGCGTGMCSSVLESLNKEVIALDISREMIKIAKKRCKNVYFVVGDALNLPFRNEVFSTICIIGVLHHILDLEKVFDEIFRCTRQIVCINEPISNPSPFIKFPLILIYGLARIPAAFINLLRKRVPKSYHSKYERSLNGNNLIRLCEERGLKVVDIRYYTHIPFLNFFLSDRIRGRICKALSSLKRGTDIQIIAIRKTSILKS